MAYQISRSRSREDKEGRFRWRVWLRRLFMTGLFAFVIGGIALTIFLKPYYDEAQKYDLAEIDRLEAASVVYDWQGQELGRIFVQNRLPVRFEEIPEHVVRTLSAAEDSRFFEHDGVDYVGICRAILLNAQAGELTQGASTITQQLARQTYGMRDLTLGRKLTEAFLARRIEKHFREQLGKAEAKNKIIEAYLNRIYFGHGFHGINAAAQGYFGKPAQELSVEEGAMICAVIKNPRDVSPLNNPGYALKQRNYVFDRMRIEGVITPEDCERLKATPIVTNSLKSISRSSHVYDYIRTQVNEKAGEQTAAAGGLRIFTTIDMRLQLRADRAVREHLEALEGREGYANETYADYVKTWKEHTDRKQRPPTPAYVQGALLAVRNEDGAIVSMVGGRNFGHSMFNCATMGRRPAGTAMTPFVYLTAFDQDEAPAFPGTMVPDILIDNTTVGIGGAAGALGEFGMEVENPTWLNQEITARRALALGKNAATARVGLKAGLPAFLELCKDAGFTGMREFNSSFLGASEVRLTDLVNAYTVFPNGGSRPKDLYIIREIQSAEGRTLFKEERDPEDHVDVSSHLAAYQTHSCLEDVLTYGTGAQSRALGLKPIPSIAGKTGTVHDFTDAWMVGYTNEITCGVWAGFVDKPRPIYRGAFGNQVAMPIWVEFMNELAPSFNAKPIDPPPNARKLEICTVTGQVAGDRCYEPTPDADSVSPRTRRCTVVEYIDAEAPRPETCRKHTPEAERESLREQAGELVITNKGNISPDTEPPVRPRQSTLMGEDPYRAVQPVIYDPSAQRALEPVEIKAAEIVSDLPLDNGNARVPLEAPKPIEFDD